jgi:hypothetical protein
MRHGACKQTPSVAAPIFKTPIQKESSQQEARDAIQGIGEPTLSVGTSIGQTPKQNSEYNKDDPRDVTGPHAGKTTPSVATPIVPTPTQDFEFSNRIGFCPLICHLKTELEAISEAPCFVNT